MTEERLQQFFQSWHKRVEDGKTSTLTGIEDTAIRIYDEWIDQQNAALQARAEKAEDKVEWLYQKIDEIIDAYDSLEKPRAAERMMNIACSVAMTKEATE